ncbi:MAG: TIGR04282 family arsenosugar biosynthesis glycosyltransferase [Pseudomonadota bacterium]
MRQSTILIFAKPPMMGLSKTRLAKSLSKSEAQRIARFSMSRTLRACALPIWDVRLYTTPARVLNWSLGGLWAPDLKRFDQGDGDLTARLSRGLEEADPGKILFIGADAPDVSTALLKRAFLHLNTHDAVFGPASDGGFWLFGLKKTSQTSSPFENVRWSTEHALADVRANLTDDARISYLPQLIDIDTAEDWRAWNARPSLVTGGFQNKMQFL